MSYPRLFANIPEGKVNVLLCGNIDTSTNQDLSSGGDASFTNIRSYFVSITSE
jgi:hypothetical protein